MTRRRRRPEPFPVEPLLAAAAKRAHLPVCPDRSPTCGDCLRGAHYTLAQLGRDLGVDDTLPNQWIARGGVPHDRADYYAMRLSLHPASVWGMDWWSSVDPDAIPGFDPARPWPEEAR